MTWGSFTKALKKVGTTIEGGAKSAGKDITPIASGLGKGLGSLGKSLGAGIQNITGGIGGLVQGGTGLVSILPMVIEGVVVIGGVYIVYSMFSSNKTSSQSRRRYRMPQRYHGYKYKPSGRAFRTDFRYLH